MINNNLIEYRDYQSEAINATLDYWEREDWRSPIIEAPTGSGKSIIVGGVAVEAMRRYNTKLRSVIIVPSKELCIQNAEKLEKLAPPGVSVDVYSASVGRKNALADIVCCTIGSIRSKAAEFGHRDIIGIDECHRVSPDGRGDYWEFIDGMITLKRKFRLFGLTATPYRGNGVWITDGKRPAFHGFSHRIKIMEMLERGFLSPLVIPGEEIRTRINTDGVEKSGYDFKVDQLAARTAKYLVTAADEAIHLAANRNKWIAFLPDVQTANDFAKILNAKGVPSGVVTGETLDTEREYLIEQFKRGNLQCLITVLALSTGFDVPDIDCILWLRSTHSPVLYVQGAGRGLRIAPGKANCLWLDFTDTTERLGPLDKITGRKKKRKANDHAPCVICDDCGSSIMPASALYCPVCGATLREIEDLEARYASSAEIFAGLNPTPIFPVSHIAVKEQKTQNGKSFLMVYFYNQMVELCREPIFFSGIAISQQCVNFWIALTGDHMGQCNNYTACTRYLMEYIAFDKRMGVGSIRVDRTKKYPKLLDIIR